MNQVIKRAGARFFLYTLFGILIPILFIWGNLVIHFTFNEYISPFCNIIFALGTLGIFLFMKSLGNAVQVFGGVSTALLLWFIFLPASNERNFMPQSAVPPEPVIEDNILTVKNFRHFKFKNGKVSSADYKNEVFDLNEIQGTDMLLSYWDGHRAIGHTFVSFRFSDGRALCVSVEIRLEPGESFHPASGMFKQFEIIYVMGDERDMIRLRTEHRKEEVFFYPMTLTKEQSKAFLVSIAKAAARVYHKPEFYHSIGKNCTTTMINHLNETSHFNIPATKKYILNGISDFYAYQMKGIPYDLPFDTVKRCGYITPLVNKLPLDENFSTEIRTTVNSLLDQERQKK